MYDLWNNNGKCPPTLMAEGVWVPVFELGSFGFNQLGEFLVQFRSRPGVSYTIEFRDSLSTGSWQTFAANGSVVATTTQSSFKDDFTSSTSGAPSSTGQRYYRFRYSAP
jgi:fluoride ion exporter CrcB/FEX